MAKPIPGKIGRGEFKKTLAGKNSFIPKKVTDSLKANKLSSLLYKKEVTREETMKALKILQKEGTISRLKRADELYRHAGIAQRDADEAAHTEVIKKHARLAIQQEIEEEANALLTGRDPLAYDKRSVLGRSVYEQLNEEQTARDKKAKDETDKKEKFDGKNSAKPAQPELLDLPDMDIG